MTRGKKPARVSKPYAVCASGSTASSRMPLRTAHTNGTIPARVHAPKATPMPKLLNRSCPACSRRWPSGGKGHPSRRAVFADAAVSPGTAAGSGLRLTGKRRQPGRGGRTPESRRLVYALDIHARLRDVLAPATSFIEREDTRHPSENLTYAIWRAGFKGRARARVRSTFSTAANEHGKPADVVEPSWRRQHEQDASGATAR